VSKPIYVTRSIFREEGEKPVDYRINIGNETMKVLYVKFKEHNNLPLCYPMSDTKRHEFEDLIFSLIDKGKIVVKKK
jgi:hypothetical protein